MPQVPESENLGWHDAGCPILAASLSLRQGWESTMLKKQIQRLRWPYWLSVNVKLSVVVNSTAAPLRTYGR